MQIQTYMSACKYSACDWEIEILFSAATLCQVDVYNQYQIEEREREREYKQVNSSSLWKLESGFGRRETSSETLNS